VQEREIGEVEVAAINPLYSIGATENEALQTVATEVTQKLQNVMDRL
jgi:hypothetical protein